MKKYALSKNSPSYYRVLLLGSDTTYSKQLKTLLYGQSIMVSTHTDTAAAGAELEQGTSFAAVIVQQPAYTDAIDAFLTQARLTCPQAAIILSCGQLSYEQLKRAINIHHVFSVVDQSHDTQQVSDTIAAAVTKYHFIYGTPQVEQAQAEPAEPVPSPFDVSKEAIKHHKHKARWFAIKPWAIRKEFN